MSTSYNPTSKVPNNHFVYQKMTMCCVSHFTLDSLLDPGDLRVVDRLLLGQAVDLLEHWRHSQVDSVKGNVQ